MMIARWFQLFAWCGLVLGLGPFAHAASPSKVEVEYIELAPAFVTVLESGENTSRFSYVKAEVVLQASGPDAKATILYHKPYLRNEIVFLLSRQDFATVGTNEGKEALRKTALARVQEVLRQEEGAPIVEDLFFSTFVIQR